MKMITIFRHIIHNLSKRIWYSSFLNTWLFPFLSVLFLSCASFARYNIGGKKYSQTMPSYSPGHTGPRLISQSHNYVSTFLIETCKKVTNKPLVFPRGFWHTHNQHKMWKQCPITAQTHTNINFNLCMKKPSETEEYIFLSRENNTTRKDYLFI